MCFFNTVLFPICHCFRNLLELNPMQSRFIINLIEKFLKPLLEKEKLVVARIFSFPNIFFFTFQNNDNYYSDNNNNNNDNFSFKNAFNLDKFCRLGISYLY